MNRSKLLTLFLFLFSAGALFATGPVNTYGSQSYTNNLPDDKNWSFIENKGQLADADGKLLSDVKYYSHASGPGIYIRQGVISFVFSETVDNYGQPFDLFNVPDSIKTPMARRMWMEEQVRDHKFKTKTSRTDLELVNSSPNVLVTGEDRQDYYENYYNSYTPETGVKALSYKTITFKNIYPHIDMRLHAKPGSLKYEFIVYPGGKASDIQLQWKGPGKIQSIADGSIHYLGEMIDMTDSKPVSYLSGSKAVASSFMVKNNTVSFKMGVYDQSQVLTIDPTIVWATYFFGGSRHIGQAVWTDNASNVLLCGPTSSPTVTVATSGSYQSTFAGTGTNGYLAKFNASGSLQWCTYYGGGTGVSSSTNPYNDLWSISTDDKNNIYTTGATAAVTGIATSGAYQSSYGGGSYNGYIVKFTTSGARVWATYYGSSGNDQSLFLSQDAAYNVYMVGWVSSTSGLATSGAYQTSYGGGGFDYGVAKYDSAGNMKWSTYFGGTGTDAPNTLAADAKGNCVVIGYSASSGLATSGAYQTANNGSNDALVVSFATGGGLNWATYIGGTGVDEAWGNCFDKSGNAIVVGQTASSSGISTSGVYQSAISGSNDVFISKFDPKGKIIWGTYYGGTGSDVAWYVDTDNDEYIYVTGQTGSKTGIATNGAFMSSLASSTNNAFLAKFSSDDTILHATYFGGTGAEIALGVHIDRLKDRTYISGQTSSSSGIATSGGYQTAYTSATEDAFLANFNIKTYNNDAGIAKIILPAATCAGTNDVTVQLKNFGKLDLTKVSIGWSVNKNVQPSYSWKGKIVKTASSSVKIGTYNFPAGADTIKVWTYNPNGVLDSFPDNDTIVVINTVKALPVPKAGTSKGICAGSGYSIGAAAISGYSYSWTSNPAGFTSTAANPTVSPTATTTYILTMTITGGGCSAKDSVTVTVVPLPTPNVGGTKSICFGGNVTIGSAAVKSHTYAWSSVPSGFTSNLANPTVSPTTTTTYYETEIDTTAGCYAYSSGVVIVAAPGKANGGGNKQVCHGESATIGAAAVTGDSYAWSSKPNGFTSAASNPTVTPLVKTTYYLSETITATGCIKLDSAIVSVNPLPAANAGGNHAICAGANQTIGSTATTGHTYSWTSVPAGFTSTVSNPTVNPVVQTAYYLKETITLTGCSNYDTTILKMNPAPDAKTGGDHAICGGDSYQLGTAPATGNTYAWTSNPKGFSSASSAPLVTPAATTTYYLTETITATGCTKTDSATITVNIVNTKTGGNHTICAGTNITLGDTAKASHDYTWTSLPAGFTAIVSNPSVTPTASTTYYLTETDNTTGCSKMDSAVIKVNPVPDAITGTSQAVCPGTSVILGQTSTGGHTYVWTSIPAGFTSGLSLVSATPTITTTYYLTETISLTGCAKKDSVKITVKPLPNAKWTVDAAGPIVTLHASDSSLNDASYHWKYGDGDTATGHRVNHIYPKNKVYTISLRVNGANGCVNQHDSSVLINVSGIQGTEPENFILSIYPNPFRSLTTVAYTLSEKTSIRISLMDVSGREIGILVDENQLPGAYQFDINAGKYQLIPGIYLVKISTGNGFVSRRVVKI